MGEEYCSGIPLSESMDAELLSVRFDRYGAIPVGTVDVGLKLFKPPKDIRVGIAKNVVGAATDNRHLRPHFFKKWNGAGTKAAMVRDKEHIAIKTIGGFDYP